MTLKKKETLPLSLYLSIKMGKGENISYKKINSLSPEGVKELFFYINDENFKQGHPYPVLEDFLILCLQENSPARGPAIEALKKWGTLKAVEHLLKLVNGPIPGKHKKEASRVIHLIQKPQKRNLKGLLSISKDGLKVQTPPEGGLEIKE